MEEIFKLWKLSEKATQISLDNVGRIPFGTLAIVTDNNDPEGRRRIKVALPNTPSLNSDWLRRLLAYPNIDPPLPKIGETVLVLYANGLESNGWYLSLCNDTNPPRDKQSPLNDLSQEIPGNRDIEVKGNDDLVIGGKLTTNADDIEFNSEKDITAEVKGNIFMNALQAITLQAAQYVMFKVGQWTFKLFANGTSEVRGGVITIDMGGHGIRFTNVGTMEINGSPIAVEGAVDSDGDVIVDAGW
ncbi:Phage-related baseplate assembly protein [Nostoc sp. PCC 7524]|uniref:phage baseplate assembly protein V n=1 Tax=Nostoc sp. (strain ATCC 29411 / PCC 7524) TaxID=28072 RepID=UPI00029F1DFC|nr:phage baseplate assembly protein V [Nostoc sp. PCC 7524]AFY49015.1 Phage-related baseplate assembly protein [Nostoc sp. PCC 7524]